MDETYIKVNGQWKYLYQAVDKEGNTINYLLTAKRDMKAALNNINKETEEQIEIRQCKYLNNIIEQDQQNIKRITRPMLGFKNFHSAQKTLAGIELMKMINKGQIVLSKGDDSSPAEQFYLLAA